MFSPTDPYAMLMHAQITPYVMLMPLQGDGMRPNTQGVALG